MNKPALLLSAIATFSLSTTIASAQSSATAHAQTEALAAKPSCVPPELVNSVPWRKSMAATS
jgi:hypothetical protein